jgi:hypothetical protein
VGSEEDDRCVEELLGYLGLVMSGRWKYVNSMEIFYQTVHLRIILFYRINQSLSVFEIDRAK